MRIKGKAVSGGVAVGKVFVYEPFQATAAEQSCSLEEVPVHLEKYSRCKEDAQAELKAVCDRLEQSAPEKAAIFVAHQDILNDVAMDAEIRSAIENGAYGDWAVKSVYDKYADMLAQLPDPLIQERAADLRDVQSRLLRVWKGVPECNLSSLSEDVIIVARDLFPSDTATLDRSKVLAILTEVGGKTSHSAIIARSYNIPAVLGIPGLLEIVRAHDEGGLVVAVDAFSGEVILNPDSSVQADFARRRAQWRDDLEQCAHFLGKEPLTADGTRIEIALNIASVSDEELGGEQYVDSVGLFRTEFIYMNRPKLPTEDEQYEIYKKVLSTFGTKPVTLRTLDIGGDKSLESLPLPAEDNPFLGNRALRLCFSRPDIFEVQLRAALRASVHGRLKLMLPMVGSMDDIRRAKAHIAEVKAQLEREGHAVSPDMKIGIMIEIPSIAMVADLAAAEVDFGSIGTNDFCQYLLAVDRLNPTVGDYYQSFHPGVLRLIAHTVEAFNRAGTPICVCGEMGGDVLAAPLLVGMGMRKLSMNLSAVAGVKRMLSELTIARMEELVQNVLSMSTDGEIRDYLSKELIPA